MRRRRLCSLVVSASLVAACCGLAACATSPSDDAALGIDESETRPAEETASHPLPGPRPDESPADTSNDDPDAGVRADGGPDADVGPDGAVAVAEGGIDGAVTGPQNVVIKLVPTRSDWLVAGQPAPFRVQLDAKNCNIFGNSCDANVSLTLSIDAPAASLAASPSCSRLQSGTGVRQCSEGAAVTKSAMLQPGDDVKVRFHAEAVDDPGDNPNCNVDKTWTFTGTGFTLKGEVLPGTRYWQCIGGGSGQNLDVLVGYQLEL